MSQRMGEAAAGLRRQVAALAAGALLMLPGLGAAQSGATTVTYSNTSTSETFGAFWTGQCVSRTFQSTSVGVVTDVKLGVIADHSRRGEMSISLTSPDGTTRSLLGTSGSTAADVNVLFDDAAAQAVSSYASAGADSVTATPYQRTYRPVQTLSGFDGKAAAGTWTLELCDTANTNWNIYGGTFESADLIITSAQRADLSLTKTVSSSTPASGSNVTYTLNLNNAAGSTAVSNVTVEDQLPAGTSFVSASGTGTYDSATGIWTVPSVPAGTTRTLSIVAKVTASAGAPITNVAEVASSPLIDPDSTPGNGVAGEDDRATASFTVSGTRTAGTPPNLVCPVGSLLFDWDASGRNWTGGATSGTFALTGLGNINFALANPGAWLTLDQLGGATPRKGTAVTGGYSPAQNALIQAVNMANRSQAASTTITLPAVVSGAQFRIFDVDYNDNQFADRVRVTGSRGGVAVMPVLTQGSANYVIGNEAFGDTTSDDNLSNANVVVTFNSPIDRIVVEYGNWSDAPADPGQQAIALHDITLCAPIADISVSKTSQVAADASPSFAVPGNDVIYTITVNNSGPAAVTSDSLFVIDAMPNDVTFFNGSVTAGGNTPAVVFSDAGSGLTYNYGTDVRFSNSATQPASFTNCTYTPSGQLDTNIRYICVNPKGAMAGKTGSATPGFSLSFRARIR